MDHKELLLEELKRRMALMTPAEKLRAELEVKKAIRQNKKAIRQNKDKK